MIRKIFFYLPLNQRLFDVRLDTMASATPTTKPLVEVGDSVTCESRVCYVQCIENTLGFNQYTIVDMGSGVVMKKCRYEIQLIPDILGGGEDFDLLALLKELDKEKEDIKLETKGKRFKDMSPEEHDNLALNCNSKGQRYRHFGL